MGERLSGRVKFFNSDKGFGFVARDDGQGEVFLHASVLPEGTGELEPGDPVTFETAEGKRGVRAVKVALV
ncbi:MAG: cold-shock DNA-binding domain protein [Bradyrhizobium sp.]|nr:cold-shock DNA-binding domain protein [Bradyrhizobium sp.]